MAAIFPIPYDTGHDTGSSDLDRQVAGRDATVLSFDRRPRPRQGGSGRLVPTRIATVAALAAIGLVAVFAMGAVFAVIDAASQPPAPAAVPLQVGGVGAAGDQVIVVQSGDTLTSIARRLQPAGDVGSLVDRLAQSHGPGTLQPGERLRVDPSWVARVTTR